MKKILLTLLPGLLLAACSKEPCGPAPTVTPMTVVDTISPEAQAFYSHPPSTFVSMDALPLFLKRAAISKYQDDFGAKQKAEYGEGVTTQKSQVAGVPVLLVQAAKVDHPDQVLMNLHGGGFTQDAGSQTENIAIAAMTHRKIVALQYRLAPENAYPAGVDDAMAVYRELLKTYKPQNIIVYGTSAGATMTAQLAVRLKKDNIPMPAALGMFSMISDFSRYGESMLHLNPLVAAPSMKELQEGGKGYTAEGQDKKDPMLSPFYADTSGWPPILLLSGTRDLLLSQTVLMQRAMVNAGVDAQLVVFEGMVHAHWAYLDFPESREAFQIQARFFEKHLADAAPSH